jgi:uncharacterized protein YbbC (DUF1343 family)
MAARVKSGIDRIETAADILRGRRIGLMTNPSGMDRYFRSSVDVIRGQFTLSALFACEHGIRGDIQAGAPVESAVDEETGIPVYSVYGGTRHLTDEMLSAMDVLVFDIQDAGVRFYTYLSSLSNAMADCRAAGKPVVVLDRVNPLGGSRVSGTLLDPACRSFVGMYPMPTQYGLTIGEYARYVKETDGLESLNLSVVPLQGWERGMRLPDTGLTWVPPSPNLPSFHTLLAYPGTCIFEGANVSEGRGTALPFELIGAPWINSQELEKRMAAAGIPGARFRRASFTPMYSKYAGQLCHGIQLHVTDADAFASFSAGLILMEEIRLLHPERFEYLCHANAYMIDKLLGVTEFRAGAMDARGIIAAHKPKVEAFREETKKFRLY